MLLFFKIGKMNSVFQLLYQKVWFGSNLMMAMWSCRNPILPYIWCDFFKLTAPVVFDPDNQKALSYRCQKMPPVFLSYLSLKLSILKQCPLRTLAIYSGYRDNELMYRKINACGSHCMVSKCSCVCSCLTDYKQGSSWQAKTRWCRDMMLLMYNE